MNRLPLLGLKPFRSVLLGLAMLGATSLPSQASCQTLHTSLSTESIDETYFHYTDLLSSIQLNPLLFGTPISLLTLGVGVVESLQGGCGQFDHWLVDVAADGFRFEFDAETMSRVMQGAAGGAAEFGANGYSHDGLLEQLIPQITPCDGKPITRLAHLGGNINAYAAHVGVAPYPRKTRKAKFQLVRNIVVENGSNVAIESPVRITGEVLAARAFGWNPDKTYAKAKLKVSGVIAGQGFTEEASVEAVTLFPETASIDVVRRITVAPSKGRYIIHLDIVAEAETEVQAKSAGIGGSLTDSATAAVDFPNSIDVGNFTGPNGTALPMGVRIYDQSDGAAYADTRVWPGAPNLAFNYMLSRDAATGEVLCNVTLTNAGIGEAQEVRITGATLGSAASISPLPIAIGRLIPELPASRAIRTLRFARTVGARGASAVLKLSGTRNGGTFGSSFRVVLP